MDSIQLAERNNRPVHDVSCMMGNWGKQNNMADTVECFCCSSVETDALDANIL